MLMARRVSVYAIYRGDHFIDVGTLPELAQRNKLAIGTLLFKASPTYAQRTKYEGSVRVYKIGQC
ncbi:hypothetical protein FC81_GL000748 [Liquorilactobacillus capillatus DSM 19910]|uniref:Uncharacterized protein n=2 Tax=Liquorilactobacillus capillatus TaxID=480931 RepID=A0A0R1M9E1_9LACO|nr:hypothetical protein FC81_GL000748 [Liquorilactobacillus capillatus DSM 19910]